MTPDAVVGWLAEEDPVLVRLAEEVSLAVLVDPPLLRRARLDLGGVASAGTEADLWFSPLVRSRGPDGFVLEPGLAEELRRRLARSCARLRRARARVLRAHAHFSPTLRLEEELLWLSAVPGPAARHRAAHRLQSAVVALVRDGRQGIVNWAARALASLPAGVLESEPARMLELGASLRFARDARLLAALPPSDELPGWVPWLLPPDLPRRAVRVRVLEDGVEVDAREGAGGEGHVLELPDTEPLLVDVTWPDGGATGARAERVALLPGEVRFAHGRVGAGVRLRTLDGELYQLLRTEVAAAPRTVRWLHLSDLRLGEGEDDDVRSLLYHVRERTAAVGPPDLVFITGDIASPANRLGFRRFRDGLLAPLLKLLGPGAERRVFVVPGNHDVDRWPAGLSVAAAEAYASFIDADLTQEPGKHWLLATTPARVDVLRVGDVRVGVACLDTVGFVAGDDSGVEPRIGAATLDAVLEELREADLRIVVGHHPVRALPAEVGARFREDFVAHGVIYLHGHSHHLGNAAESTRGGYLDLAPRSEGGLGTFSCTADVAAGRLRVQPFHELVPRGWARDADDEWVLTLPVRRRGSVYLSYAREEGRGSAAAVRRALDGEESGLCAPDGEELAFADRFPEYLVEALLDARVVVVVAEPSYFRRWHSLLEFRAAIAALPQGAGGPQNPSTEANPGLASMVVVLPRTPLPPQHLPPYFWAVDWPTIEEPDAVAEFVIDRLAASNPTLRERLQATGRLELVATLLLDAVRLPPPVRLGRTPLVPALGLPSSLGDAFVGRADLLWQIHDALVMGRQPGTGATVILEGAGGFGKTRVALEYLYRFGPLSFPGGLFWIDAGREPEGQLFEVLRALDPAAPDLEVVRAGQGGLNGAVTRAIRSLPTDRPPLFVVDNVPEPEPQEPPAPLTNWCPLLGEVPVLVTSRMRLYPNTGVVAIALDTLAAQDAVALLSVRIPRDVLTNDEWEQIAVWVGHLPLALEILNGALSSGAMSPRALLDAASTREPSEVLDAADTALSAFLPPGALRGVSEAFALSYKRLTEEQQRAARLLAWLAPEPIPQALVEALGFSPAIRATLRARSFVSAVGTGVDPYGRMHPLLADSLRSRSPAPREELEQVSVALHFMLSAPDLVEACAPHIEAVVDRMLALPYPELRRQALALGRTATVLFAAQGLPESALRLLQRVVPLSEEIVGPTAADTLTLSETLATVLTRMGRLDEALTVQAKVLEVRSEKVGMEDPGTLTSAANMAGLLLHMGSVDEARRLGEEVLAVRQRVLGHEHPDTLASMEFLARTLSDMGRYAEAGHLLETVVAIRSSALGEKHPDTLRSGMALALLNYDEGDLVTASEILQRVVADSGRALGDEHPFTLASMSNLGTVLSARGELGAAREVEERVLETRLRVLGEEHPSTLDSMVVLARTLRETQNLEQAKQFGERALATMRRVLGDEHPRTLEAMIELANTLREMSGLEEAQELQERALEAMRRVQGDDHPRTLAAMRELAETLRRRNRVEAAQALEEEARQRERPRVSGSAPLESPVEFSLGA